MQRRKFTSAVIFSLPGLFAVGGSNIAFGSVFTESDAARGVRTALERAAVAAVEFLGRPDGFLGNPNVRIPLPGFLHEISGMLRLTGQQKRLEALEIAMNRAAESAVPQARALLISTIKNIGVEDASRLVRGSEGAVTRFFSEKTREPLGSLFLPIVTRATDKVALAEKYNDLAAKASNLGLLRKQDATVEQHVTAKALDGLYTVMDQEERKIRQNPLRTGSDILRKVFGP